ncbi:MAG: LemA family protein [bacterium]
MFAKIGHGGIIAIAVGALIIIIILWFLGTMNRLRKLALKIAEAESGIDVALTKRFEVLMKLLEIMKCYAKSECEKLAEIIKWRNGIPISAAIADKEEFFSQMDTVAVGIAAIAGVYPTLIADVHFKELQIGVANTDEQLQAARRLYNAYVTAINAIIGTFPDLLVANAIRMEKKGSFEAEAKKPPEGEFK